VIHYIYKKENIVPRKSATQRQSEIKDLLSSYNPIHRVVFAWDVSFLEAMEEKILRKKALTKKMRAKIDELIALGPRILPTADPLAEEYTRLAESLPESEKQTLHSFAGRLYKGYNLSLKQKAFAEDLANLARDIRDGNCWNPSAEDLTDMKLILDLGDTYDRMWLETSNPSAGRAIKKIKDYFDPEVSIIYQQKHLDFARKKFASKIKKIKHPRFASGDMAYITKYSGTPRGGTKSAVLVVSDAYIGTSSSSSLSSRKREIVYTVLINGELQHTTADRLKKR